MVATTPTSAVQRMAPATTRTGPSLRSRLSSWLLNADIATRFLILLLGIFLCKGVIIAFVTPAFSGHDEVAHYSYLKVLAEDGRPPLIPDLKQWRADYDTQGNDALRDRMPAELYQYAHGSGAGKSFTTDDWFGGNPAPIWAITYPDKTGTNQLYPSGWIYTGNHPPLYYMLLTPVFWLINGNMSMESQLYILRLASIPMGMAVVVFAFLTSRTIFPRDRFLAMTVPAFVAFQPQISYESAMLNNDIAAIMFTSATIWMIAVGLRRNFPYWNCLLIGLMFGLAFLSKSTSVSVAVLIAFAMVLGIGLRNVRQWVTKGAVTAIPAAALSVPWLTYMMSMYGSPTALNRVEQLQWWNNTQGRTIPSMLQDRWFFWDRWQESWGAFGWRLIFWHNPNPPDGMLLMRLLLWVAIFATFGIGVYAIRFLREQRWMIAETERTGIDHDELAGEIAGADSTLTARPWQMTALAMMAFACVLGYYSVLQFGTTFSLTQARYYFPFIIPGAFLFMLGVRSWFPRKYLSYVAAATFMLLVLLNLTIYTNYVIPYWNLMDSAR